uniref:NADH-ubiquinone oxidoreductase chain 2 n=1 Tax=Satanas sp. KW-2016 TaxID=1812712 RepID=A0A164R3E2_9MUSC|nr:NADH dehydrogenase subunit 2 [Satanas sp. KW-2016]
MYNNSAKIMFMSIMMSGTMLSVSSTSWMSAWMGLEINLLAFIPLMTASSNLMSAEAALKYFLTQALASSVLLMAIIISSTKYSMSETSTEGMLMMSALLLKLGAAPFHWWFPNVMEGLTWNNSMMLMTWQSVAPLMLSSTLTKVALCEHLMTASIIMSVTAGSLGGLNQTSLRKIMAYSSITHISWMMTAMMSSEPLWSLYFTVYTVLTVGIVMIMKTTGMAQLNQLFSHKFSSSTLKFTVMMSFLSLGGLPPFLGFLPKLMVIQNLVNNNQMFTMTILTIMSLITLFFYLRMAHSAFMLNYHETTWNQKQESNNKKLTVLMILSFISNSGLFTMSMVFMML